MVKPNIKYRVTLTGEEWEFLRRPVGNSAGYLIRHTQPLPALDEIPVNESRTDDNPGKAYDVHTRTMGNLLNMAGWIQVS
ncbi:MAG: hypothetical protein LBB81_02765 [Treponema sp.]|nr:hypothetical protein [Treponema sp.]